MDYSGKAFNTTEWGDIPGTLNDTLGFMKMWDDVKVNEIMRTDTDLLCYRY